MIQFYEICKILGWRERKKAAPEGTTSFPKIAWHLLDWRGSTYTLIGSVTPISEKQAERD
jgi:hypothetical protein